MARATELLLRKEGATAKEINAVTDWPVGQRHINKLAKLSGATIKALGDKHWQLIKPAAAAARVQSLRKS